MGSIQHIYNPESWQKIFEGKSKIVIGDYIYIMEIGYCKDELSTGIISEYISKDNYEGLLNGDYAIMKFPYHEQKIILLDKDNNIVPLVKGKNDEVYTENQKEQIKRIKKVR